MVALRNDDALLGKLLQEGFRAAQGGAQGFGERKQVAGGVVCEMVNEQLALGECTQRDLLSGGCVFCAAVTRHIQRKGDAIRGAALRKNRLWPALGFPNAVQIRDSAAGIFAYIYERNIRAIAAFRGSDTPPFLAASKGTRKLPGLESVIS